MNRLPALTPHIDEIAVQPGGGYKLLELLSFDGWTFAILPALAGGVLVVGEHRDYPEVRAQGESVAAVAPDLFKEALAISGRGSFH